MEAKNLYARHLILRRNRIVLDVFPTLLLIGMLWMGISAQAQTTIQYSQSFTAGTLASPTACNAWSTFRASLAGYVFSSVTISGSLDPVGITNTDVIAVNGIANALTTGSPFASGTWKVGGCSTTNCGPGNIELDVNGTISGVPATTCGCNTGGYSIRPDYGVAGWWGGIGPNCGGVSQTLTLTFTVQPVIFTTGTVNGSGVFEIPDTVCQNSGAVSINSKLTVSDRTTLTETWTVNTVPSHGTVNGLPYSAPSGLSVTPAGVTYTPTVGFSGVDSFKIQVNNGSQTAIANIIVTVNPSPAISCAGISYCPGGSGTLTASGATTYSWAPATALSATTGASVTASPTVTTTYTITGTAGTCSGTTTATVTVNPLPTIGTTVGSGTATCAGTATSITATGAATYTWSPSTGLSATTGTTVSANPPSNQTYVIAGTSAAGCSNTGNVTVTVNSLPVVSGGSNTSICIGNNTTLTASGANTYSWSPAAGLSAVTGTNVVASPTATTTYSVTGTITATGCQKTATVTVTVNPLPAISGGASVAICNGSSTTLSATGGVTYTWAPSTGLSAVTGASVTANPSSNTTYTITGTNGLGCVNSGTVTVTVNPMPLPITGNTQVSTTITTQLSDATSGGTWTSSLPGNATVNAVTGLVSGVAPGSTLITYALPTGCSVNATVNVNAASVGLNFNGTSSYVQLGNILTGGSSYTKEAWINVVSVVSNTNIVSSPDAPFYIQSGHLQAANNYLSAPTYVIDPGTFPTGQWVYVAVSYDQPSNTMKLYRNGILVATNTTSASYTTGSLQLGAYSGGYLNNETMDEVRVWNIARTQAQIQASMNCDIPQQANLIAYYRFDEGVAGGNNTNKAYVLDYSGNANCGTLNGFSLTGPGSNFVTGAVGNCAPITISVPAANNSGTAVVCVGQTSTLSNSVPGGTWTSGNTGVATVNSSTGVVSGVTGGTANITYTLNCGTAVTTVTVNPAPSPITGTPLVCAGGGTSTLNDGTTPGTWSSSNGNATIGAVSGILTGVTPGNSTITYTLTNGCFVTTTATINTLPVITGSPNTTLCYGQSATLTAGGGTTYSWAPSVGLSSTFGPSVVATPTATTTYTVTGSNATVLTYSQAFTGGVVATTQCTAWTTYRASLINGLNYTGFTIRGSNNTSGFTCTDPSVATAIANALRTGTATNLTSDGHTWFVGTGCGGGCGGSGGGTAVELAVDQGTCACGSIAAVRPGINNTNWGGISGPTCGAGSQTLEVDFYVAGCSNTTTITVSVNPLPVIGTSVGSGTAICNGSSTAITATGADTYFWSPATGLDVTTGAVVNANPTTDQSYLITGTDINGCVNTANVTVTVNPLPDAISGTHNFCLLSTIALGETTSGGTWSSTNTSVATVDPATGVVSGIATGVDTIIYTLPTTCSVFVSGTVNPVSDVTVSPLLGQTVCNGASTTPVTFSGSIAGTVFDWTNTLASIGIPASGSDTIFSVSAINTSYVSDTGFFTVTPVNNGCPGLPAYFYIAVNPTPDVYASNPPQTLCNGTMTAPVTFAGDVDGTIFTWTNSNSSIGIGATGTGDIASFTGIDTSAQILTAVITVNTSAAGCTGSSNSFTITIDPTPLLLGSLTSTICDNSLFNFIPSSLTLDSTFIWSRDSVTGITASAGSGINNTNEYLDNTTLAPINVTYVYVVQANGCTDTANIVVTVNPTPHLTTTLTPSAVCDSTLFTYGSASTISSGVTFTWSRASVAGISNPAASGIDTIREYLVNTTPEPLAVPYVDTLTYFGCQYTEVVTATVNPKPVLTTPVTLSQVCDSTTITYVPASATTGTTFTWSRAAIAGNPAANGVDTIHERLVNTTTASVIVTYVDTLKANGCWNTENVNIRVMPTPMLSSSLTPASICDSVIFNYTPASATAGTGFTWVRPFIPGILNAPGSGIGNPNEQLINTTNDNLDVTYIYTLNDSGCTNVQDVVVRVHPTPVLSSPLTSVVCSGTPFVYGPTSFTAGTTFSWKRGLITGITPATDSGSGVSITETLANGTSAPVVTGYQIKLTANTCSHLENITVTVNPTPAAAPITTFADDPICTGTMYQNFGTSGLAPAGESYNWSAQNAVINAHGSGNQYILVTFNTPGPASVILTTDINAYGCRNYSAKTYTVSSSIAQTPQVVYFNGQFVCLQNNLTHYQWGYDDAITLDSSLIAGEVNPNYFNNSPDLTYKYYWVATTDSGGCTQKTYYNVPTGITNINAPVATDIKVYPNPANEELNVVFNDAVTGKLSVEVVNILGQKLMSSEVADHKAMLNVASVASGTYLVVCYSNGVKIGAVRFVKN